MTTHQNIRERYGKYQVILRSGAGKGVLITVGSFDSLEEAIEARDVTKELIKKGYRFKTHRKPPIAIDGEERTLAEWCRLIGVSTTQIYNLMYMKRLSKEEAIKRTRAYQKYLQNK
jgi:hypothetical protein